MSFFTVLNKRNGKLIECERINTVSVNTHSDTRQENSLPSSASSSSSLWHNTKCVVNETLLFRWHFERACASLRSLYRLRFNGELNPKMPSTKDKLLIQISHFRTFRTRLMIISVFTLYLSIDYVVAFDLDSCVHISKKLHIAE